MKKCPPEIHLSAYLDGELPDERLEAIERHLQVCPLCGRVVEVFRHIDAVAAAAEPPPVREEQWQETWAGVVERSVAAPHVIVPASASAGWRERLGGMRWLAAAAVLVAAIGFGSYIGLAPRTGRVRARSEPCVVEYLEPAEGYMSVDTHSEEADLTLITVVPSEGGEELP